MVIDDKGQTLLEKRQPTNADRIRALFCGLKSSIRVVMEATGGWTYLYESMEDIAEVLLAHPLKTKSYCFSLHQNRQDRCKSFCSSREGRLWVTCTCPQTSSGRDYLQAMFYIGRTYLNTFCNSHWNVPLSPSTSTACRARM